MKLLSNKKMELIEILTRGGVWSTEELSKELGVSKKRVRVLVKSLRINYLNKNGMERYVYLTKGGYTIDELPEHVVYESKFRMKMGFGVLINGTHPFRKCKAINLLGYKNLMISFKPKMLELGKVVK